MSANKNDCENGSLAAALTYASQGFKVVACYGIVGDGICTCGERPGCKPGKHPIPKHGHLDATTDPELIRSCWRDHPWANIGIVMGNASGVFVVESDPRNGGDETMAGLIAEHGSLPATPTVKSGGGGEHRYYRLPPGVSVKSKPIAKGIDAKGSGLVIAPPSMHASGNRYTWVTPLDTPLADAPEWLLALACEGTPHAPGLAADNGGGFVMGGAEPNDFATHPGAERGTQNDTMMRVLGLHLNRGDSLATIESLALAWAERCSAPIPTAEVLQRLKWAESKRAEAVDSFAGSTGGCEGEHQPPTNQNLSAPNGRAGDGASASTNSGEADDWPVLHADAYHGLAGDIVRAIEPETEADPRADLLSLLVHAGNAIGRGAWCDATIGDRHRANEFAILVGDTASGKGQAEKASKYMMRLADSDADERIGSGLSSGEGLIEHVRDHEPDDDDEDGSFTVCPERRFIAIETEFGKTITVARRDGNSLNSILKAAWDGETLQTLTRTGRQRGKPLCASNAHVSVIGHITPTELALSMGKAHGLNEIANGYLNRFLWVCVKRSKLLPHGGNAGVLHPFADRLRDAIAKARTLGQLTRTPEANALWEREYEALTTPKPGSYGLIVSRGHAHVVRLSLIYAALDGSRVIGVEHLRAAMAVWRYCEASASRIFGGVEERRQGVGVQSHTTVPMHLHLRLLDVIAKSPGVSRRGLHEATGNRVKAGDMEAALAILEAQRLARRSLCQSEGGGRPAECWWPGPGDDPSDDDPSNDDPSDGGKGVTFTMGGGDPVVTDSASASTHARGFAASIGRPEAAAAVGETERDVAGLRTNKQTPAPTPVPEIIRSQSFFAGGIAAGGGDPPPSSPESVCSLAGGGVDMSDGAKAPSLQPHTPTTYPSPTPTPDTGSTTATDTPGDDAYAPPGEGSSLPKCSCGAVVERPSDEYCKTCFEAALREALMVIADSAEQTNPPITTASGAAPPSST